MTEQQNHTSHLTDVHSRIYTCQETILQEYFHISIWSELFEQTALAAGLKED